MANRHVSFLKGMYFFPFGGFFLYDGQPPGWSDAPWKILRTEVGEGVFRGVPYIPGGEITGWWFRICLFSPRTRTLKKLPNLCGKGLCGCRPWKKWMVHGWGTFWPRALRSMPTQTSGHWPTPVKWSWPWCQSSHWRSLALRGLPVSMRSLVPKVISLRSPVWAPCRSLGDQGRHGPCVHANSQLLHHRALLANNHNRHPQSTAFVPHTVRRTQHVCLVPSMVRQPRTTTMACCSSGHCKPGMREGWDAVDGIQDPCGTFTTQLKWCSLDF